MKHKLISTAVTTAIATVLAGGASLAMAQQGKLTGDAVKIGVLTDMSGLYADYGGPGAVAAARMAVADFGGTMFGKPIEVISADHQNKPDIAKNVAQGWFDRDGVDISVENLGARQGKEQDHHHHRRRFGPPDQRRLRARHRHSLPDGHDRPVQRGGQGHREGRW